MSLIAQAIQPHTIKGLMSLGAQRLGLHSVPDLLINPRSSFDLDFDNREESISFDFRDAQSTVPSLGFDCSRFATASFQSAVTVQNDMVDKNNLAWGFVKLYYSAFYAGHSIIRLLGESCSFFDRPHITRITSMAVAMGKNHNFAVHRGLYHCRLNSTATAFKCTRAGGFSGGAHETFWKIFETRIHQLSESILLGALIPTEAQSVFGQIQSFEQTLNIGAGMHGALSNLRNDLQYRHLFGVWFPVGIKKRERERLGRLAAQWQRDPMDINFQRDDILSSFVISCTFIICLCRAMILRIAEFSIEGSRCFVSAGPLSFLREAGLLTAEK